MQSIEAIYNGKATLSDTFWRPGCLRPDLPSSFSTGDGARSRPTTRETTRPATREWGSRPTTREWGSRPTTRGTEATLEQPLRRFEGEVVARLARWRDSAYGVPDPVSLREEETPGLSFQATRNRLASARVPAGCGRVRSKTRILLRKKHRRRCEFAADKPGIVCGSLPRRAAGTPAPTLPAHR